MEQITEKYCQKCKTTKPVIEFWKNKTAKDGLQAWCKTCWSIKTAERRNGPKREIELRQRRSAHLMRSYGINVDQYDEILIKQGGVCAICKNKPETKNMAVDHDHATLKVRGILCENCNRAIGLFYDNVDYLHSAIRYLSH